MSVDGAVLNEQSVFGPPHSNFVDVSIKYKDNADLKFLDEDSQPVIADLSVSDVVMVEDSLQEKKAFENPEEEDRAIESDTDSDYPSPRRVIQLLKAAGEGPNPLSFEEQVESSVEKIIKR